MPEKVEITCDQCGRDLTQSSNCIDYRLGLVNQRIPSMGGFVTAMAAYPAIDHNAYFCGVPCCAAWLAANYPNALSDYEKQQRHRQWLNDRMEGEADAAKA